ncbi:MAG TPA: AAA family ATPase, partial [Thermoleophilia bacterium]|nr:AAA family ATPase [Thermoleophilia bacterium]
MVLSGFKSFRDWNLLELSPQVTVIVGGNGTGKSSLVEALLWTLGEDDGGSLRVNEPRELLFRPPSAQWPGQVHSETKQHVLFTHRLAEREAEEAARRRELEARAQEAVAYMVLGDESAPECGGEGDDGCCSRPSSQHSREVPEGLITVKRHLDREGVATYELEGAAAIATQVKAALSEHGISRELISVIRQGELERVLLADPELRARILAQAAGVEDPEMSD